MSAPSKKPRKASKKMKEETHETVQEIVLKQVIRSLDKVHQTTDRKLQEMAAFCMDKKCNE